MGIAHVLNKRGRKKQTPEQIQQKAFYGFAFRKDNIISKRIQLEEAIEKYNYFLKNCQKELDELTLNNLLEETKLLSVDQRKKLRDSLK